MLSEPEKTLRVFYCYARKDKLLRDELERHLELLRHSGQITTWYDREIQPGTEWRDEIDKHLNSSDIILLLVSSNFMSSKYCYGIELQRALKRHEAGEARIIPIILRPVDWKETPIGELQVLPTDGKPISRWSNRDEAFLDVARGIRQVVTTLLSQRTEKDHWVRESAAHCTEYRYTKALTAYEQVLRLAPDNVDLLEKKANVLVRLGRYEDAVTVYNQAISLLWETAHERPKGHISNMTRVTTYCNIGDILRYFLRRYNEAIEIYQYADKLLDDISGGYESVYWTRGIDGGGNIVGLVIDTTYNMVLERSVDALGSRIYGNALTKGEEVEIGDGRRMSVGKVNVRDIVRHMGHSSEYKNRFISNQPIAVAVKFCYKHFLGRDIHEEELQHSVVIANAQGFEALIDSLIDSEEYMQAFGENSPPIFRG